MKQNQHVQKKADYKKNTELGINIRGLFKIYSMYLHKFKGKIMRECKKKKKKRKREEDEQKQTEGGPIIIRD